MEGTFEALAGFATPHLALAMHKLLARNGCYWKHGPIKVPTYDRYFLIEPNSTGLGSPGLGFKTFPHISAFWYTDLLVCCNNAAPVEGIASMGFPFEQTDAASLRRHA